MNSKVKMYTNPHRSEPEKHVKYVPQYQTLEIEPEAYQSAVVPNNTPVAKTPSADNPRVRKTHNQPYADVADTHAVTGSVPNVGNNMDYTWSGVDGQIIDDLGNEFNTSPDHPMIDNNDFVTSEALNLRDGNPNFEDVHEDNVSSILQDLDVGSYLLLVNGVPICSGPSSEIEDQVRALVFGEHELSGGVPIPEDSLIVLKKVPIKVGVFLD